MWKEKRYDIHVLEKCPCQKPPTPPPIPIPLFTKYAPRRNMSTNLCKDNIWFSFILHLSKNMKLIIKMLNSMRNDNLNLSHKDQFFYYRHMLKRTVTSFQCILCSCFEWWGHKKLFKITCEVKLVNKVAWIPLPKHG